MKNINIEPKTNLKVFTCPHCGTLAEQKWGIRVDGYIAEKAYFFYGNSKNLILSMSRCNACSKSHLWLDSKMILPEQKLLIEPVDEMPEDVKDLFLEARDVFYLSPKSSGALLRLSLQLLCKNLGEEGKNINKDIGNLVKKGLDLRMQKFFDAIRIVGNESVHPGELNLNENPEMVAKLFLFINKIVEKMIIEPKEMDDFFGQLPEDKVKGIEKRDGK